MPMVRFLRGGRSYEVAVKEGDSLMQAAVRNGVPGIEGECGGELSCATCHVHVPAPWSEKFRSPSADELDMLEGVDDLSPQSRLGCQIKLNDDLDGLEVVVP